jgi:hypothetical protein
MATIKKQLMGSLSEMTKALDNAGDTLMDVREKLDELKSEIGEEEFSRQAKLKDPSPQYLKYISCDVWANNFQGLIESFCNHEARMRRELRTKTEEALQSSQEAFYEVLDGLTSLMSEYAVRLWAMVMRKARELMTAASEMWSIIRDNPGKLAAFLFGATVGGMAAAHAGFSLGLGLGLATGGIALIAGLVAVGVYYACSCAYQYFSGKIQEYRKMQEDVDKIKESVNKLLITNDLSVAIQKTKEDMFHQMDVYESKFLQCDDAP